MSVTNSCQGLTNAPGRAELLPSMQFRHPWQLLVLMHCWQLSERPSEQSDTQLWYWQLDWKQTPWHSSGTSSESELELEPPEV